MVTRNPPWGHLLVSVLHACPPSFGWPKNAFIYICRLLVLRVAYRNWRQTFFVEHIEIAVFQNSCAFSGVFSWKRLKMAIYKLYILILEFSKERIETIFRSIGVAVQDLADFSFIFSHIWIAYISRTKPSIKNLFDKFWGLNMSSKPVKFCENRISRKMCYGYLPSVVYKGLYKSWKFRGF